MGTKSVWDKIYAVKNSLYTYLENENNTSNIDVLAEWYTFSSWIYSLYRKSFAKRDDRKAFEQQFSECTNNYERVEVILAQEPIKAKFSKYAKRLWKESSGKEKRGVPWKRLIKADTDYIVTNEEVTDPTDELDKIADSEDENIEEVKIRAQPIFEGYTENPSLNGVSTSVRLGNHEAKRRQLIANDDLALGELIASEGAVCAWLSPTLYNAYCYRCLLLMNEQRVVCRSCKVSHFCSVECFQLAQKDYHGKECAFMEMLKHLSICHFALRLMILLGPKRVCKTYEKDPTKEPIVNETGDSVQTFLNLESGTTNVPQSDLLAFTCTSLFTHYLIKEMSIFKEKLPEKPLVRSLISMMIIISRNIFTLYDHSFRLLKSPDNPQVLVEGPCKEIGYGLFYKTSLFNHSCRPNAHAVFFGASIMVVASKPIPANTEITISYGASYPEMRLEERQNKLKTNFYFSCLCEQCDKELIQQEKEAHCDECSTAAGKTCGDGLTVAVKKCAKCHGRQKCQQKIEKTRTNAMTVYTKGRKLLYKEEYHRASRHLKKAEKLFRQVGDFWYLYVARDDLVTCYRYLESFDKAYTYALENLNLRSSLFGKDTVCYINCLLVVMDLSRRCGEITDYDESPFIQELYALHEAICSRQVRIVEYSNNYFIEFLVQKTNSLKALAEVISSEDEIE